MRPLLIAFGLLAAMAVLVLAVPRLFVDVPTVGAVSFVNRTPYSMEVGVTGSDRDGWLALGTADRDHTTLISDVADQGAEWIFRFQAQGRDGGEMRLEKEELIRSEWRVVIPDAIARRLETQDAPPSPMRKDV